MPWEETIPVVAQLELRPDPGVMLAIGLNHTLSSAIADLVDNSIDARGAHVIVRFVRSGDRVVSLMVIDDGLGIGPQEIDQAMTVGWRRRYGSGDLGRFGIGLKAASLGQSESLTFLSARSGRSAGRRWTVRGARTGFICDVVDEEFAARNLKAELESTGLPVDHGTIVRWDDVKQFRRARSRQDTDRLLQSAIGDTVTWLGLVFHRFLEKGVVAIEIDVQDAETGERISITPVSGINPFGYLRSPRARYPALLTLRFGRVDVGVECHVWPARSPLPGFRFRAGPPERDSGFYFYRNDRLLQVGGWNNCAEPHRSIQLARCRITLGDVPVDLFGMNPEKTEIVALPHGFRTQLDDVKSPDGGVSFGRYLLDAEEVYRRSHETGRHRRKVVPPGRGLPARVRRTIQRELSYIPGEAPLDIRWADFSGDEFFDLDFEDRVLYLNRRYRSAISGDRDSSLNDVPTVKTLLYLLMEPLFRGAFLGARERNNVDLWQALLTAAARSETE